MSLNNSAKLKGKVKGGPKAIAETIVAMLETNKIVGSVSIVKTGIINIRLNDELLVAAVKESVCTGCGPKVPPVPRKKVAVDFSSPNIAKVVMRRHIYYSYFFLSANAFISLAHRKCMLVTCVPLLSETLLHVSSSF